MGCLGGLTRIFMIIYLTKVDMLMHTPIHEAKLTSSSVWEQKRTPLVACGDRVLCSPIVSLLVPFEGFPFSPSHSFGGSL